MQTLTDWFMHVNQQCPARRRGPLSGLIEIA
jgi:hypothetical protein